MKKEKDAHQPWGGAGDVKNNGLMRETAHFTSIQLYFRTMFRPVAFLRSYSFPNIFQSLNSIVTRSNVMFLCDVSVTNVVLWRFFFYLVVASYPPPRNAECISWMAGGHQTLILPLFTLDMTRPTRHQNEFGDGTKSNCLIKKGFLKKWWKVGISN